MPRVIPRYGNSYKYTNKITASVSQEIISDDTSYVAPPRNAWNRGPPKTIRQSNQSQCSNVSSVTSDTKKQSKASSEQLTEINQNLEQYQQYNHEILNNINNKLETKMNGSRTMIKEIVKDILQADLKAILPEIATMILQQIKESTDQSLWLVKDFPGQNKPTDSDKVSVLTQTTQVVSKDPSSASKETPLSDKDTCLLTQEEVEKQEKTKLDAKSNNKSNQFPRKLNQGKICCSKVDDLHKSMANIKNLPKIKWKLILGEKTNNNAV